VICKSLLPSCLVCMGYLKAYRIFIHALDSASFFALRNTLKSAKV
jgi:hypothetical protein